jgi:hypothetical protein
MENATQGNTDPYSTMKNADPWTVKTLTFRQKLFSLALIFLIKKKPDSRLSGPIQEA